MATQCSAVANRRALTPDYYSRKKLTVTSNAFVRNCRARSPRATRIAAAGAAPQPENFCSLDFASKNPDNAKIPMKRGFMPRPVSYFFRKVMRAQRLCRAFSDTRRSQHAGAPRMKKFFAQQASAGVLTASVRRKTRESVPTDSRRRHVSRPREASRGVAERRIRGFVLTRRRSAHDADEKFSPRVRRRTAYRCVPHSFRRRARVPPPRSAMYSEQKPSGRV
jgi:hypothetical protein